MKKFVFATLMCVAAMSAKAQVLTSETVNNVYEAVSNKADGDYCYNAERKGKDITTMFVYQKATNSKGDITLKPHLKYEYDYLEVLLRPPLVFLKILVSPLEHHP